MTYAKFTAEYEGERYEFDYGSKAYIFDTGIYNGVDKARGIKGLLEYVEFVHDCYIKDENRTNLGALADFIAKEWDDLQELGLRDILSRFYEEGWDS